MLNTSPVHVTGYIAYLSLNGLVPEESISEVAVRNPRLDARRAPEGVFAFFYYNISHSTIQVEDRAVAITSERHTISGQYFIDGTVLTIEDIRRMDSATTLLEMMEFHGWKAVVETCTGNMMQFDPEKDKV